MIKIYKCNQGFYIDEYDADGFSLDKQMKIVKGSKWEYDDKETFRVIGGTIRLYRINVKRGQWIEINNDTLNEYFEQIQKGEN